MKIKNKMKTITIELFGNNIIGKTVDRGEFLISQDRNTIWINDDKGKCVLRIQKRKY